MIQSHTVVAWAMPVVLGLAAIACMAQPLVRRSETITPARDPAVVEAAILKALANRGWVARSERPGSLLATLDLRTHQVVTRITYSGNGFEVDYVSSKDMGYTKDAGGQERIHRNYNGWVANVVRDTEAYLEGRQPDGGLLEESK